VRKAAELRAEVLHLRTLAKDISDDRVPAKIQEMVEELERLARQLDNGGASD
jgi:hypothetical protein